MKKMRWIAFLALALVTVMLFASCAKDATIALAYVLDEDVEFETNAVTLSQNSQVSKLTDYEVVNKVQNLILFENVNTVTSTSYPYTSTTYYKLAVYNIATKNVVWEGNYDDKTTNTKTYSVELKYNWVADNAALFVVKTTTTETVNFNTRTTERAALYDSCGMMMAETYGSTIDFTSIARGYVYADGTVYTFQEDGRSEVAFEYPAYLEFPYFDFTDGENYYSFDEDTMQITVYDSKFEYVDSYQLPVNAEWVNYVVMRDGKLLVQYDIELEDDAKKYDFIYEKSNEIEGDLEIDGTYNDVSLSFTENKKYDLVTLLVDLEKDKVKEVKTDLAFLEVTSMNDIAYYNEEYCEGLSDAEEISAYVMAAKIEDGRVNFDRCDMYAVDAKAKFTKIESVEGNYYNYITRIAEDRWIYCGNNANYMIDGDGTVISRFDDFDDVIGDYILVDDKIYDMDLELVLDLNDSRYSIVDTMADGLLLSNVDGDVYLFNAENEIPKMIADKDAGYSYRDAGQNLIVVKYNDESEDDDDQFILYNRAGTEIARYDAYGAGVSIVYDNEYGTMISVDVMKGTTSGRVIATQYYVFS